jgi:hypothetical protein
MQFDKNQRWHVWDAWMQRWCTKHGKVKMVAHLGCYKTLINNYLNYKLFKNNKMPNSILFLFQSY